MRDAASDYILLDVGDVFRGFSALTPLDVGDVFRGFSALTPLETQPERKNGNGGRGSKITTELAKKLVSARGAVYDGMIHRST